MNEQIELTSKHLVPDGFLYQLNVWTHADLRGSKPAQTFVLRSTSPLTKGDLICLPIELPEDESSDKNNHQTFSILRSTWYLNKPVVVLDILSQHKIVIDMQLSRSIAEISLDNIDGNGGI